MYDVIYTGQFRKSLKLCVRRGLDIQEFTTVLDILQEKGSLPSEAISCQNDTVPMHSRSNHPA